MPAAQDSSDPRRYLDPKVLANISRLELKARLIVEGFISGLHRSPYHGLSIEFAEHREYVPGDDIRHIDWKVFGRSDRFYIKQYEEETNLKLYVLLDASESMAYPEAGGGRRGDDPVISKFEYSTYIAAALSYLVLRQQDAVGMAVFDDRVRQFVPPSSSPGQLQNVLDVLDTVPRAGKTDLGMILNEFADRIKRKGLVVIISDCFDSIENVTRGLQHLRYKEHEVLVFHVLDHEELTFPFQRMTLFEGMEALPELVADPRALRRGYLEELNAYLEELRKVCRQNQIDYVQLDTRQKLHVALTSFLAKRAGSMTT